MESDGNVVQGVLVTFSENADIGELEFDADDNVGTPQTDGSNNFTGVVTTDANGQASVNYYVGNTSGVRKIDATTLIDPQEVTRTSETFTISVGGARDEDEDEDEDEDVDVDVDDTASTITVIPESLSDEPGTVATLAVAADGETVRVTGSSAFTTAGGTVTGAGASRVVTLPNTPGSYSLTVSASGYDDGTVPVTVTAAASTQLGTLSITAVGTRVGDTATDSSYLPEIQTARSTAVRWL